MAENRSYTIHKSKKSQVDKMLTARESLRKNLEGTSHRLETIADLGGVEFISDTRSTDLLSTRDTFKCIVKPMVWLAATTPHDRDYALLEKYIKYKVKAIVVYGHNGDDMRHKLEYLVERFEAKKTLHEAVIAAHGLAKNGDAIVFSPSCAANDGYVNFADRGGAFKRIIEEFKIN